MIIDRYKNITDDGHKRNNKEDCVILRFTRKIVNFITFEHFFLGIKFQLLYNIHQDVMSKTLLNNKTSSRKKCAKRTAEFRDMISNFISKPYELTFLSDSNLNR